MNISNPESFSQGLLREAENILVTFQSGDLIRSLMKMDKRMSLPSVVDLQSLDKQMSQQGKEFRNDRPWKLHKMLRYHGFMPDDHRFGDNPIKEVLEFMSHAFQQMMYKDILERQRFEEVEIPINDIIYKRQSEGILFDVNAATKLCATLERKIYDIKNQLQFEHGIYNPDDEKEQLSYIYNKGYGFIKSPQFTFKSRRNTDRVCELFYEMLRAEEDLNSVLYMLANWGGSSKCYPIYSGFGTITSRITLREPSLQNLRKCNRAIIVPDTGKKLLYVDYSQFEAGILASLSGDPLLINLYNSDIYEDLARVVLNDSTKRADAKVIFYRYMYGDDSLSETAKRYFNRFGKMRKFKATIVSEMDTNQKVGTSFGNFRFSNGEEHGWSLSHRIQGTASLIYKNAVIRVANELPTVKFLIPMHDATLYQVEVPTYEDMKSKISLIYQEEFQKLCPEIVARVTVSDKFH
jgi:DNA polymerase I-like protein with 3'-5' exonuclease and polymerase domains